MDTVQLDVGDTNWKNNQKFKKKKLEILTLKIAEEEEKKITNMF